MTRFPGLAPALALAAALAAPAAAQEAGALGYTDLPARAAPAAFEEPPAPEGTVEYNLWLGRMFNDVLFNTADPAAQRAIAERIVDPDYLQHNLLVPTGREGLLGFMPYLFGAMPDVRFVLHDVIATEDRVVTRWTWTGTLTGEGFLGIEPQGQRLEFDGIDIWSVRDGKLYEHWDQFDWPRALIQLGLGEGLPQAFHDVAAQPTSR